MAGCPYALSGFYGHDVRSHFEQQSAVGLKNLYRVAETRRRVRRHPFRFGNAHCVVSCALALFCFAFNFVLVEVGAGDIFMRNNLTKCRNPCEYRRCVSGLSDDCVATWVGRVPGRQL